MASTINASTSAGLVSTADTSGVLQLQTAGTTAVTVDASQNVGIGTSSPGYKLDVRGTLQVLNGSTTFLVDGFGAVQAPGGVYINTTGTRQAGFNSSGTDIRFRVGNADDRMVLDASGNLGLGVTPSAWGPSSSYVALDIGDYAGVAGQTPSGGIEVTANCYGVYSAGSTTWRYKQSYLASRYQQGAGAHAWFIAPSGTAGNAITFTQAMTLDASGNLLVGATSNGITDTNSITLEPTVSGGGYAVFNHATGSSSGRQFVYFAYGGGSIGSITQSGTTAVLYNVTSDQRLKENIVDAPEFGSVIDSLQVRSFDWKSDGNHQRAGFVAQELVSVAPEAVHQPADPDEMMAVDYSKLVPMLVKEIQSLRIRIAQLEAK